MPEPLVSERLILVPATLDHLDAELRSREDLERILSASVPQSWPPGEYDSDAIAFFRERLLEGGSAVEGWYGWYALHAGVDGGRELVAGGGFLGPPRDETVEVGYSVVPEWERRGLATEIVNMLTEYAFRHPGVRSVIAHTAPGNAGSQRVLERCGFTAEGAEEHGTLRFVKVRGG